jgi:hypothetical protein
MGADMTMLPNILALCLALRPDLQRDRARRDEHGDVPGWVLITVMTAGLVAALWAVAGPQLNGMLSEALSSVRG